MAAATPRCYDVAVLTFFGRSDRRVGVAVATARSIGLLAALPAAHFTVTKHKCKNEGLVQVLQIELSTLPAIDWMRCEGFRFEP